MYIIRGKVRHGKDRGKKLGYPTANINFHEDIPHGIYISQTLTGSTLFNSVTFVGNATTFNEKKAFVETHIFNFDANLYNKWIEIRLLKKIRKNMRFENAESLVREIRKDIKTAKKYFKQNV